MANKIILKKSSVPAKVPLATDLDYGELAINYADGKLYYKTDTNTISSISGGSSAATWTVKTTNYTTSNGDLIVADSSGGPFSITLPASPSAGNSVQIADGASMALNQVTVLRNGSTIEGLAEDLVLDVEGVHVTLIYDGSTWETFTSMGTGTGTYVTLTGTETLTNKTLSGSLLYDGYTEEVFTVTGTTPALSPTNGSIQTWTLTGNSTPTIGTWSSGQSITLMIDDGTSYAITWPSVTWVNNGETAPTLKTSGYTVVALWKVGTTVYGAIAGSA